MHIEWKKTCEESGPRKKGCRLTAVIVAFQRGNNIDSEGCIEKIGTIEERFLFTKASDMRAFHQGLFWEGVARKLSELNLPPEKRAILEAEISIKVPRPNEEWALWGVTCIPRYDP